MGDDKSFLGVDQSSGHGRFHLGNLNEAIRIVSTKFATEVVLLLHLLGISKFVNTNL